MKWVMGALPPTHVPGVREYCPRLGIIFRLKVLKIYVKTDVQNTDVDFLKIATLNQVRRFGINGMRLLSKPGAIMHPFETQFSLQGAFHGKSALSVSSNGSFEETYKAEFLIGGGQLVVRGTKR